MFYNYEYETPAKCTVLQLSESNKLNDLKVQHVKY